MGRCPPYRHAQPGLRSRPADQRGACGVLRGGAGGGGKILPRGARLPVSDRYINRAVFLRCGVRGGHHNLFLLQLPNRKRGLNHVAFTVRDIHEVIGGGIAMNKHDWSTFIGPGRHPVSSAYFWYVNSPTGGAFEYYTNDDYLTENWQPRELEHSTVSFTEWAVEGGIDHDTRRQQKKPEAV